MNSYERVIAALQRKQPDRVPISEWEVDYRVIRAIDPRLDYFSFVEEYELDLVCTLEDIEFQPVSPTRKKDHFGIVRDFSGNVPQFWPMPVEGPIRTETDLDGYVPPDPDNPSLLATLRQAVQRFKGRKAIAFVVNDSFLYPSFLRGMDNYLADFILDPPFARKVARIVNEYYIRLAQNALREGADLIVCGDDYCGKNGPFMSPAHFREYILPGLRQMVRTVKENGGFFVKHCDGFVWPILDMMVSTGIDAFNPIQPDAGMDIAEVKKRYGQQVCLIGNIDCAHLLPFGEPDQVEAAVKDCFGRAARGGGYILSSSNVIHSEVKPENFLRMLKAARAYGEYPISL
jgi:uroporphyrinogen decarboxylase